MRPATWSAAVPETTAPKTDRVTVDAIDGVENLDATPEPVAPPADPPPAVVPQPQQQPAADTAAILPTVGKVAVVRSHGKLIARAPVSCPAAEAGGCRTALTLETAKAVKLGKVRAVLVLGSASVSLAPGESQTVSVRVNRGAASVSSNGKLSTRIQVSSSDAAGNTAAGISGRRPANPWSLGTTPPRGGGPAERGASSCHDPLLEPD